MFIHFLHSNGKNFSSQWLAGSEQLQVLFQARVLTFQLFNLLHLGSGMLWLFLHESTMNSPWSNSWNNGSCWFLPAMGAAKIDLWQTSRHKTICCYCNSYNSWKGQPLRLDGGVEWTWSFRWHLKLISWNPHKHWFSIMKLVTWSVRFGGDLKLRTWHRE